MDGRRNYILIDWYINLFIELKVYGQDNHIMEVSNRLSTERKITVLIGKNDRKKHTRKSLTHPVPHLLQAQQARTLRLATPALTVTQHLSPQSLFPV